MPQKTRIVLAGPLSGGGGASAALRDPREAGGVAGVVLEILGQHHRAVAAGGEARADRGDACPVARPARPRARRRPSRPPGRRPRREVRRSQPLALPERLRVREHHRDLLQRELAAGGQAVGDGLDRPRRSARRPGLRAPARRAPGRRRPRARSRPAPAPARSAAPAPTSTTSRSVASGTGLGVGRRRRQRLVADRPGRAEVGDPQLVSRITDWTSPPASASRTASSSSGES